MAYSAKITQINRQTIVFLIDRSGSMSENIIWNGDALTKADAVCDVVNNFIEELVVRCNNYGDFKSYFNVSVVGYGGNGVGPILGGSRNNFYTPNELAYSWVRRVEKVNLRKLPDGKECVVKSERKIWVEPYAEGKTPMIGAFNYAHDILLPILAQPNANECFPPIVINITDGEATDGTSEEVVEAAGRLKKLSTSDGSLILMNVHIANCTCDSFVFPSQRCELPVENRFAQVLFDASSVMPEFFEPEIEMICNNCKPFKAFAYNATISDLIRMINVGSSTTSMML